MNREIVVGFLKEHGHACWHRQISQAIKKKRNCTLCANIIRDSLLFITNMSEARKTVDVGLALSPETKTEPYRPYAAAGFSIFQQKGSTESERISEIFDNAFSKGYDTVIVTAYGIPNIPVSYLEQALRELRNGKQIIFGPLANGKFYLIGIRREEYHRLDGSNLMNLIDFANAEERDRVIALIKNSCEYYSFLPQWYTIHSLEDLKRIHADSFHGKGGRARWTTCMADDIV
jgi:glycosyltransferase A (GT-A) superfamily protein (DUF2064 family)